jgi:hypothetical protein
MLWKITRVNVNDLKSTQKNLKWSINQEKYKDNIIKNGYNPRISIIIISKDNRIIDGHHRVCSLIESGNTSVIVMKIKCDFWVVVLCLTLFFIITSPIWVSLKIFKKIKNGIKKNC